VRAAADPRLRWASVALLAAVVLHDLDHVRQGRTIEGPVVGIGVLGDIAAITAVVLALRASRWAPHAAVLVGFGTFLGFIAVHVVPDWGPLADGYPGLRVDALSWVAVAVPMTAAAVLGFVGLARLRDARSPTVA
jgi:hypothetical protein